MTGTDMAVCPIKTSVDLSGSRKLFWSFAFIPNSWAGYQTIGDSQPPDVQTIQSTSTAERLSIGSVILESSIFILVCVCWRAPLHCRIAAAKQFSVALTTTPQFSKRP